MLTLNYDQICLAALLAVAYATVAIPAVSYVSPVVRSYAVAAPVVYRAAPVLPAVYKYGLNTGPIVAAKSYVAAPAIVGYGGRCIGCGLGLLGKSYF